MNTQADETQTAPKKRPLLGQILSAISLFLSLASRLWLAWLLPIVDSLAIQGRLHEGDPDGCFYGMLMVPTYFIVPLVAVIAIILGIVGFRLRARTLAIIAWIAALLTLLPMWSAWGQFLGK
jgi:hypothetical protein